MLAQANRVVRPGDFRTAVRKGRRVSTPHTTIHVLVTSESRPSRFGFIVTKAVGGAVVRNTVRRRLRAVCRDILDTVPDGTDVVIRALPASADAAWATLHSEVADGLGSVVRRS
ncbi:ribonuclease P protein component [Salinibacterium soli]|uniref:Ribonuclease P protein component n=1 Tax=Antiquaquibacter soli TaxID=3064523 RepID=A0ABT9BQA2_9MICO|nr:ribonuclease P protein component [Protaetiibacter sp. WY-16]MDO7883175.1 ribonuclease P protein component [Protaetiibacter sp. WY-16]